MRPEKFVTPELAAEIANQIITQVGRYMLGRTLVRTMFEGGCASM